MPHDVHIAELAWSSHVVEPPQSVHLTVISCSEKKITVNGGRNRRKSAYVLKTPVTDQRASCPSRFENCGLVLASWSIYSVACSKKRTLLIVQNLLRT